MKNNKKMIMASVSIVILAGAAFAFLFLSKSGKNILNNGAALAGRSWNDIFEGNSTEIIPQVSDQENLAPPSSTFSGENTSTAIDEAPAKKPKQKKKISPIAAVPAFERNTQEVVDREPVVDASSESVAPLPAPGAKIVSPSCAFPDSAATGQKIILNEIAWMGSPQTPGGNSSDAGKTEWMEIKNISSDDIALDGWQIIDKPGKLKIIFDGDDEIASGGIFLLTWGTSSSAKIYSGDLVNGGDVLAVVDPDCNVSDILDASKGWPGGNNATKQTLERNADGVGWHTSVAPGGTPGAENSTIVSPQPLAGATSSTPIPRYNVTIAFQGDGSGTIMASPAGLNCTAICSGSYASGTTVSFSATPSKNALFSGWSDPCYGEEVCSFVITKPVSLAATFRSTLSPVLSPSIAPTSTDENPSNTPDILGYPVIAAVQIGGASTTNDFIKIYNPTSKTIDIGGWKFRKKSSTGSDASLKVIPASTTIAAAAYFVWANSSGGFSETVSANISSTETLSADNSVALMDASGTVIDAVAWGTGNNQYVEGTAYPTNPMANQILVRNNSQGMLVDTGNNANDFTIQ